MPKKNETFQEVEATRAPKAFAMLEMSFSESKAALQERLADLLAETRDEGLTAARVGDVFDAISYRLAGIKGLLDALAAAEFEVEGGHRTVAVGIAAALEGLRRDIRTVAGVMDEIGGIDAGVLPGFILGA